MAVPARNANPADLVKHYTDLIMVERGKLEDALSNIAEYADALRKVTIETSRRLISHDR